MSSQYDLYLEQHINNVAKAFDWLRNNLPELFSDYQNLEWQIIFEHDRSKYSSDEYDPYDTYFYGNNRSCKVINEFRKAWLLHIHRNPHHWQHWILLNDEPDEGKIILEMPYNYIIEMICDWWSFSFGKGNLGEIFSWYNKHSEHIELAPKTRKTVENILQKLYDRLGYNTLSHHGVKGQKWGVKNGPPYPIDKTKEKSIIVNEEVFDPESGDYFNFSSGTKIKNPKVFAGKGTNNPLNTEVAEGLSEQIGGEPNEWQHCKGIGTIDYHGEDLEAEVHWFQESSVGKHKFKIKKWMD